MVGFDYYSVLVNTAKLNKYGFLPKVGHWIRVTGVLSKAQNDFYDPSISRVSVLEHIDPPMKKKHDTDKLNKFEKVKKDTKVRRILDALSDNPKDFKDICLKLGVKDTKDIRDLRNSLKVMRKKELADINEDGWFLK
ncbi:MAG: hypothetical protein ACTSR8_08745 [Promethearchaeota archaeon]